MAVNKLPMAVLAAIICALGCLASFRSTALAQTPGVTVASVAGSAGSTVDLPVTFTAGATGVSALQFDLTFPSALSYVSVTTGSAATTAGKSASGNAISGGARILVFGLTQNAIGSGSIATIRLNVAEGTTPGVLALGITGIVASDPAGTAVAVNGLGGAVTVGATGSSSDTSFTQITLSNVGNSSVTINWTTNKPTTGLIQYGPNTLDNTAPDSLLVTSHATALGGLIPSTVYHYRVTATDANSKTVTSSLLTFKTSDQINQPAKPSSGAVFMPSLVENSRFRSNLGVNNLSSTLANVSITLVDKQGMVLASKTVSVDPKGLKQINSVAQFLSEGNLGNDIQGSLYLESDQPVYAWTSQIENSTNDPSLLLSKPTGTTKILIPSAANTSTFSSSLVVMNLGTVPAQVALTAYSVSGAVLGQTTTPLSISPNGLLSFENILENLGVTNNYGPVEITSLNNVPLVASSRVSSTTKTGGFFEGLKYSEASITQIIPNIVDDSQLRTNIGINNVADQVATVMVRLINQDGVELGATPFTVAPKGLTQVNNVARQLLNQSGISNFEGYVRLESNQPIFGWASIIDNSTNDPGFALSRGTGTATHLLVESTANIGSFRSSLVVINPTDSQGVVDIISRDQTGKINGELRSVVIPARGYFSSSNILQQLGVSNNFGPLEILSTNGQPILATSRVYSMSGTSGFFEGESIE